MNKDDFVEVCSLGIAAVGTAILYLVALLLGSYLFSMSVLYSIIAAIRLPGTEYADDLSGILVSNALYGTAGAVILISAFFLRKAGNKYAEELKNFNKKQK